MAQVTKISQCKVQGIVSESEQDRQCYEIGNLVWGKILGHPWWPGQIKFIHDQSSTEPSWSKRTYCVQFFGDSSHAYLQQKYVHAYHPHRQYYISMASKTKKRFENNLFEVAVKKADYMQKIQELSEHSSIFKKVYREVKAQKMPKNKIKKVDKRVIIEDPLKSMPDKHFLQERNDNLEKTVNKQNQIGLINLQFQQQRQHVKQSHQQKTKKQNNFQRSTQENLKKQDSISKLKAQKKSKAYRNFKKLAKYLFKLLKIKNNSYEYSNSYLKRMIIQMLSTFKREDFYLNQKHTSQLMKIIKKITLMNMKQIEKYYQQITNTTATSKRKKTGEISKVYYQKQKDQQQKERYIYIDALGIKSICFEQLQTFDFYIKL